MHIKMVSNNTLQTIANSTNVAPSRLDARRDATRQGRAGACETQTSLRRRDFRDVRLCFGRATVAAFGWIMEWAYS
ncbi:hypothetical protein [Rhodopirellula bahusiensis]|uniref:Uncharacterized protein n=1 Tax=Rhodopirellula bahusiensis TaxID=2014065 RepID=A0A2G1W5U4_9BACT|nr:hypothetical protein [Rhodopirellula bahusiensis]PHQ34395.1 hypothetical protein CEE69_15385 [Rhodopirellula bahusiensis]